MSFIDDVLNSINQQRAALTGGAAAPDETDAAGATAATGNGTGGATAPDATASEDRLAKALKTLRQNGAGPAHGIKGLKKFGGEVLGYGKHDDADPGHTGSFAVIRRGGKLFHLFDDGTKMKIDGGAVARALGIHEKRGDIGLAHGAGNGTGGAQAPGGGGGGLSVMGGLDGQTGGAQAPDAISFRGQQPGPGPGTQMEGSYSRGPGFDQGGGTQTLGAAAPAAGVDESQLPPGLLYLLRLSRGQSAHGPVG